MTDRTGAPAALATLHALLDEGLALQAEYEDQLSSHLPMALDALLDLGAEGPRLREFQQRYAARLSPLPAGPAPTARRPDAPGRIEDYPQWLAHYRAAMREPPGRDALLRRELPMLMLGVGSVAFHGLIRTGHALRHGHEGELAAALAYWASRHMPLPPPGLADRPPLALGDWLAALRTLQGSQPMPARRLIFQRMAAWSDSAGWQALAGRLPVEDLPALAHSAAALYARTGDFTVLHLVTASAALRLLAPWLDEQAIAVPFGAAVAAALLSTGALQRTADLPAPAAPRQDWTALVAAALAQHDDHVLKLVAACRSMDRADPAPVWRAAAARALRLDDGDVGA